MQEQPKDSKNTDTLVLNLDLSEDQTFGHQVNGNKLPAMNEIQRVIN